MSTTKKVSKEKEIKKAIDKKETSVRESATKDIKKNVLKDNKTNSKSKWILIGTVIILATLICLISVNETPQVNGTSKMDTWLEDTRADEYVVTVIGLSYCEHCENYNPIISSIAKNEGFKLHWFDIDNMDNKSASILTDTYNLEQYTGASPYTFITKNGEFVADVVGGLSEEGTRQFLIENGVLEIN